MLLPGGTDDLVREQMAELAELARQSGEEEECQRELREAQRLFTEIGASGHAERLAGALAMPAG